MAYFTESDLNGKRYNITENLDTDGKSVEEFISDAENYVNQDIEMSWYRSVATESGIDYNEVPYDSSLILDGTQFKDLAVFKCLFLIYEYLAKPMSEPDANSVQRDYFQKEYDKELSRIIGGVGISYDWDSSGVIEDDEKNIAASDFGSVSWNMVW